MEINVCFATNDRYAPHAAALIVSIMENKSPEDELSFHFFSDKTTPSVQNTFHQMSRAMGFRLAIYEMSDEQFVDFPIFMGSRTTYFRLSMHRMLPDSIKKILYLDCDMIVMSSLKELYSTDISDCYAAVVAEALKVPHLPVEHPYFNAGMVLFNLEKYRDEDLEKQAIRFGYEHPDWIRFADQEILNYIFKGNVVYLPLKWNMMLEKRHREGLLSMGWDIAYSEDKICKAEDSPAIIHYVSRIKPWLPTCRHPDKNTYWEYARKTPFYEQVIREYWKLYRTTLAKDCVTLAKDVVKMPERLLRQWIIKPLKKRLKAA